MCKINVSDRHQVSMRNLSSAFHAANVPDLQHILLSSMLSCGKCSLPFDVGPSSLCETLQVHQVQALRATIITVCILAIAPPIGCCCCAHDGAASNFLLAWSPMVSSVFALPVHHCHQQCKACWGHVGPMPHPKRCTNPLLQHHLSSAPERIKKPTTKCAQLGKCSLVA